MPWHALWPDFLKKRLCRYLLQHYLGGFFKEKISLEQLSIDIYNGTGCVKNLNLDCDALNEQLNDASNSNSTQNNKTSIVPIEIVSGFVGYISVFIPWHDLFNDFCKLTIKNVQITIRVKQRKPSEFDGHKGFDLNDNQFYDEDVKCDLNTDFDGSNNSMFSSMFVDSIMNTSMHIAQECLNDKNDPITKKKARFKNEEKSDSKEAKYDKEFFGDNDDEDDDSRLDGNGSPKKHGLLGLEAFASTIDSILSRIKINLENIQVRIENLDTCFTSKFNEENIMSSSTMFLSRPSNGIALELRIKSIKYFDLDSTTQVAKSENPDDQSTKNTNINLRNTTKSFNIEGLTIYFDEFIVKDDNETENLTSLNENTSNSHPEETSEISDQASLSHEDSSSLNYTDNSLNKPQDESPPFNYELNPDYYLYTNPIIFITFSGIQTIKLTINNMRPSELIAEAAASESMTKSTILSQKQRPLMELNAQFGSIKCLLCPKQIHLLIDMTTKLTDYVAAGNAIRKAKNMHRMNYLKNSKKNFHQRTPFMNSKPVRGCDKQKYEALIQNNLVQDDNLDILLNDDDDDDDNFKHALNSQSDNEKSIMFYSMMSESTAFNNVDSNNVNISNMSNSFDSNNIDDTNDGTNSSNQGDQNKNAYSDEENDKKQQVFVKELKEVIEQLQTDIIVANSSKTTLSSGEASQHNLFQTFKVAFRMFSLTVLHHDPLPASDQQQSNTESITGENTSNKRMLVDRMKSLSDNYFDWVSTIDASNLTSVSSGSIDKQTLMKYHQALAYNDHFLILMKPINFSLNQKINQRYLTGSKRQSQLIQYSLNEVALSVGYIHLNEYLVAVQPRPSTKENIPVNMNRRIRNAKIIEASQAATITELISFSDVNNQTQSQMSLEQPCIKLQVVVYEPLELINTLSRSKQSFSNPSKFNANGLNNIQSQLLNRHFENITINLNQSLTCEVDISIIDRLYYLINDISKYTGNSSNWTNQSKRNRSRRSSTFGETMFNEEPIKKFQNFEIKCSQVVKLALRFPIADLRRAQSQMQSQSSKKVPVSSNLNTSSTSLTPPQQAKKLNFLAQPATMCAFRQLRDQILTFHVFDFSFQTLLNQISNNSHASNVNLDQLNLIITCSQINAYYQYSKKERPIHFALIQQRLNQPRSLIVSIRLPMDPEDEASDLNDLYNEHYAYQKNPSDLDSLKTNYNINVGKANRFNNTTIQEESENEKSDSEDNDSSSKSQKWHKNKDDDNDESEDDDDACGPFSRIHSLISSEKNRRIVNAGNKQEMQEFIHQSKHNSQTVIQLGLPSIKLLVADQKFLNDIYNCFLNDLILWLPSPVPPIESALNLFYDSQNNPTIFTSNNSGNMANSNQAASNLNYLIDYNFDTDFIATRMNLANNIMSESEEELRDNDDKKFHMCQSAILKPKSDESDEESDNCESDNESARMKFKRNEKVLLKKQEMTKQKAKKFMNNLSVIVNLENAHLKAFVLNKPDTSPSMSTFSEDQEKDNVLKYGEFDIKTKNFHMCIAISENLKVETSSHNKSKSKKHRKSESDAFAQTKNQYKIEKQHISIYTDEINISHSTKKCEPNVQQLKYPTNFASFENLFHMSKTNDLITINDPSIGQCLFNGANNTDTTSSSTSNVLNVSNATITNTNNSSQSLIVPMVAIGIKSKFNTKKNTKQLLVALNFKNLSLHHVFQPQQEYWIFQLIELFDLIDIDVIGYEVPIVLTELHLNVENSCVLYKPLYLPTTAIVAFKSLHWSSNVTAESSLTLLVFNIEDIYLFISKLSETNDSDPTTINSEKINLKRDYICVANSDVFELRLLINDEEKMNQKRNEDPLLKSPLPKNKIESDHKLKTPLLDIKIRSNLIQLRTCVDSAFALIELINYIVSDGDLYQPNLMMSEFMSSNQQQKPISIPAEASKSSILDKKSTQNLVDEMISAIYHEQKDENETLTHSEAINIINQSIPTSQQISCSIPIQKSSQRAPTFTIGTPPTASFSFKSSSSSFNQQVFYSPQKSQGSMSPTSQNMSTIGSSLQDKRVTMAPLPQPSLSFSFKNASNHSNISIGTGGGSSSGGAASGIGIGGTSSSAESLISDMVKEAMTSNPLAQSVYGSLTSTNLPQTYEYEVKKTGRKRYTSLTLPSKTQNEFTEPSVLKTVKESNLKKTEIESENSDDDIYKSDVNESDDESLNNSKHILKKSSSNDLASSDNDGSNNVDADEDLISSIRSHHKSENILDDSDSDEVKDKSDQDENFQFDLPFSDLSPFNSKNQNIENSRFNSNMIHSGSSENADRPTSLSTNRQLLFDKNKHRLQFKPQKTESEDDDDDDLGINYTYNRHGFNDDEGNKSSENEEDLLRDFDVIEVIPGFGEAPKNNKEFDVKILSTKTDRKEFTIKEDHFKKPLTKVDVLKAPESYPCPLNIYCVQEISLNWCMYGGNDFIIQDSDLNESKNNDSSQQSLVTSNPQIVNRINRAVSSPIIVAEQGVNRSRHNSTSSNSLSISPQQYLSLQSPDKNSNSSTSPSSSSLVKFSTKSTSVSFAKNPSEKLMQRKAGGRMKNKYDHQNLNWMARGGRNRNLDVCMEIALYKVKTKVDLYADLTKLDSEEEKKENESPLLYRVALAIGDIEIRDKLSSSPFNMFLFRYESDHCPKHTNSNMFFLKFLCSKSMDAQRLLECDIKVSIQPLRFNIDQDALIFLVEFFTKMASKDLNEFSKKLVPPPPVPNVPETLESTLNTSPSAPSSQSATSVQTPQQVFIRNFIFSPDLLVRFDFSGKYDGRSETKMDTLTKLLMFAIQLSNTEIKLKRICYRRGFLGAEKLFQALLKEWLTDIQRNQMKNLIKGWAIFNSLIQFFEGFTYLIWYPIEQYRKDGRVLCGIQKGSAAFSTCTVLATIELTNRMFQTTKNVAEFFYDLVTPHRANSQNSNHVIGSYSNQALVETILTGVGNNRNIRLRRHPNDIREGLTNAYYVMYEGMNDTATNLMYEVYQGAEHKGIPGAIGGALRQLPSTAIAPIVLTTEATCNILSGIRNQLKPDEKRDDDQKWKTIAPSTKN